jgi:purine-binding chemotaxis protein CheW
MAAIPSRRTRSAANKYLTFVLAKEHYGIPILKVQEIIGVQEITPVPRMPPEVRGVLNLRGKVIPVIDLRLHFGFASIPDSKRTCIIVVQLSHAAGEDGSPVIMGAVVDQVSEVQDIPPDQIEPAPAYGSHSHDRETIAGVGKIGKRVVMILNIDQALGREAVVLATP